MSDKLQSPYYYDAQQKLIASPPTRPELVNTLNFNDNVYRQPADALTRAAGGPSEVDFNKESPFKAQEMQEEQAPPVADKPAPEAPVAEDIYKTGAVAGAKTVAEGGSAEDAASAGLIASGNPYAMAGGLALSAFSANQKQKYAQQSAEAAADYAQVQSMEKSARTNQEAYHRMRNLV